MVFCDQTAMNTRPILKMGLATRSFYKYTVELDHTGRYRVNSYRHKWLTALDSVMSGLDGQGETEYFKFKCFKNENLHLKFKRLDLLNLFNKLAGNTHLRSAPKEDNL
ncbi:MAG: DUF4942 domain-containing protein [Bacteroidota bacterium]|nr:DUF4942 domain-containing protein [Bacteroidota bacterium]